MTEARQFRELVERENTLAALAVDRPRGVCLHSDALAEIGARIDPLRIALHVRQLIGGRPEPGLLLLARGSPVGAVHDSPHLFEVPREGQLVPSRR
jgi:hypothetical protein